MPYKRNYRRKRPMTRKRTYRKRYSRRGNTRIKRNAMRTYMYKSHVDLGTIVATPGTASTFTNYTFALSDIPNPSDYTSLYDQYKLAAVKMKFIPAYTNSQPGTNQAAQANPVYPFLDASIRSYSIVDYDGLNLPTTIPGYREYQNCKVRSLMKYHTRYLKPKMFLTSGTTQYNLDGKQPWISVIDSTQAHHGVSFATDATIDLPGSAAAILLYRVEATYYLKFRNVK
ncbi:capsid protein [Marmot associated feces virus 6]|uniref:Capsid protein n=1 Tax=Marmot associated feces virus 6 TaxID=2800901 RepID=A0A7T7IJG9_9VIRU|nr:capsid protein [Marmot associated feces virus 6]